MGKKGFAQISQDLIYNKIATSIIYMTLHDMLLNKSLQVHGIALYV